MSCAMLMEREYYKFIENQKKTGIASSQVLPAAKCKDLKTEMLGQDEGQMSLTQWTLMDMSCAMLMESDRSSRLRCDILKADGHGVLYNYGLKQGAPVQLKHILAVFIYCNFPNIRQRYLGDIRSRGLAHFGRLLREMVEA